MRHFLFLLIGVLFQLNGFSQEIKVAASNKPLNIVLLEIRDKYDVDFSFNDQELGKYKISTNKIFTDIDLALQFLLKNLPFEYEKVSGVYIIFPGKKKVVEKPKLKIYRISGRIMESKTGEVLPFSNILINSTGIITDHNGNFLFSTTKDSIFNIKVSHLGYLIEDTIFYEVHKNVNIYLTPSEQQLKEIKIKEKLIEDFFSTENDVATIKLNHRVTKYLPGSSDNSVFNLLRLQPGVLAAGEQSSDLVIWGAYAGQSRVIFDGFTVFGLKNFNDNISAINPLMTKSIQLRKAGYDASYGDCVGGIVDISGKDGNMQRPSFQLDINNLTLNSLIEIPLFQKSSLQVAYRQTYYNLYSDGYNLFSGDNTNKNSNISDINIYPDYSFKDFNGKYTFKDDENIFYISALRGGDEFSYSINTIRLYRNIEKTTSENNLQTGVAGFYERKVNNRLNVSILSTYSNLNSQLNNRYDIFSTVTNQQVNSFDFATTNDLAEIKFKIKAIYQARENHSFEMFSQVVNNTVTLKEDSSSVPTLLNKESDTYYTIGLKDVISLNNKQLNIGIRTSYLPYFNKTFIEPRISFSHNISENFRYNLAWGIYKQFLVKSSSVDEYGNYNYNWVIADNDKVMVLHSNHFVSGISFNKNNFFVSLDAFYKTTSGLTRYFRFKQAQGQGQGLQQGIPEGVFEGDGYSSGFDFYSKYNFRGHTFWMAYTWSKSLEHFSYMQNNIYLFAPQDQRHEIKIATIINLNPVFLSANYVFGSGFLERPYAQILFDNRIPYSRLDVSATYRFKKNNFSAECGVSILNVLDTKNQKYSNFEKIPLTQTSSASIYFEAVPFTPTLFLNIKF